MNAQNWPFGSATTCLAKIHPGTANVRTPYTIQIGESLVLSKQRGQHLPHIGWHKIDRKAYNILRQEKDQNSGMCIFIFRDDPTTEEAQARAAASRRTQLQQQLGLNRESMKDLLRELLFEENQKRTAPSDPEPEIVEEQPKPKRQRAAAPDPEPEPEPVLVAEPEDHGDDFSMDFELDIDPAPVPEKKSKRRGSSRRKVTPKE